MIPARVARLIHEIRGEQVMLDSDLAELYGVETRALVQQVSRNRDRFPGDFMFRLSDAEVEDLKSHSVMPSGGWGGRRTAPYAFTEQGVAMLSSVLRSKQAVAVNIGIMRAFVELRHLAQSNSEIASRVDQLESEVAKKLGEHDEQLAVLFEILRTATITKPRKGQIGFIAPEDETT